MKIIISVLLFVSASLCVAQLPFQVKPRQRGFPGKHDGIKIKENIGLFYRLNNTFIPSHYDVEVRVILDNDGTAGAQFTAPGKVRITGVNQERTSRIVLHANNLEINTSSIVVTQTSTPGQPLEISGFSEDDERDFFIIELETEINAGDELEIYLEHVAEIIDSDAGLFTRTYETDDGEIKRIAATQLASVEARRMFPCFDEPDLKATFEMTAIRRDNYTTLSNTELVSSTPDSEIPGWVIDKFARTAKMSTYLLAILVSDYSYAESVFGNKPARTYAPSNLIERGGGKYTAEAQAKVLSFYEIYYNETYKLSKMDSVAVNGFGGAMENWGMNVYGTSYILFFPGEEPESHRNLVTLIIAHELAHQWFGNLVTMKWWSEVYLNEGITTYAQYLGMEAISPDLNGVEYAILDAVQYSMIADASPNTHPLSFNVTTPEEIAGMFSTISYEKGASVMRMVEGFLTRETLRKGLIAYLKKMSYQGAEQSDLFESLEEAALSDNRLPAGLTMPQIMHTWTDQAGYPVVQVNRTNSTHVTLSQQRFILHESDPVEDFAWYVPVTIVTEDKPNLENNIPQVWLENSFATESIAHDPSKWIMINQNATGFYRSLYDESLIQLIQNQLEANASVISPLSRSQLLNDYFVFTEEKYVNIQTTLNLTRYLAQETHFTVWSTFFDHFASIYLKFSAHPGYPVLQSYLQPKVDSALTAIGVEESSTHTGALAILRADLLDWACSLKSTLCQDYAKRLLVQWQASPSVNPVSSVDARATLECAMVAAGGKEGFDFVFTKYQDAKSNPSLREELLGALTCATDVAVIEELLNKTLSTSSGLLRADWSATLEKVAGNPSARHIILQFLSNHIEYIVDVIGEGSARPVGSALTAVAKYSSTQAQLEEVEELINENQDYLTTITATLKLVVGLININIKWMDGVGFDVWMWLWFQ